jgi:hypothetical protein
MGVTDAEHLENLEKVFLKMSEHGLKLNKRKCVFFPGGSRILWAQSKCIGVA